MKNSIGEISSEISDLRALVYLLQSEKFERLYSQSYNKEYADELIEQRDRKGLIAWLKNEAKQSDLSLLSIRDLKKIAKERRINPHQSKEDLVEYLQRYYYAR